MDVEAGVPEITCKIEEPEWLGPEVIGREIVNPGINEDKCRRHLTAKSFNAGKRSKYLLKTVKGCCT